MGLRPVIDRAQEGTGRIGQIPMATRRVLIIAKTYPELSSKYGETVCTAAVDEEGHPMRLYPIPFRYMTDPQQFQKYQWISADLNKNPRDARPESYSVRADSIRSHEVIKPTRDEWGIRADAVLKWADWQYSSFQELSRDQQEQGRSIAFMRPRRVKQISVKRRSAEDAQTFEQKLGRLRSENAARRSQLNLFEESVPPEMKSLEYTGERVCVDWLCGDVNCSGHSMQILDWEICELARRSGVESAKQKVEELLDLSKYKTGFFVGNIHMYPSSFVIIGLWYPKLNPMLF